VKRRVPPAHRHLLWRGAGTRCAWHSRVPQQDHPFVAMRTLMRLIMCYDIGQLMAQMAMIRLLMYANYQAEMVALMTIGSMDTDKI
jgi:hypothetical protein